MDSLAVGGDIFEEMYKRTLGPGKKRKHRQQATGDWLGRVHVHQVDW